MVFPHAPISWNSLMWTLYKRWGSVSPSFPDSHSVSGHCLPLTLVGPSQGWPALDTANVLGGRGGWLAGGWGADSARGSWRVFPTPLNCMYHILTGSFKEGLSGQSVCQVDQVQFWLPRGSLLTWSVKPKAFLATSPRISFQVSTTKPRALWWPVILQITNQTWLSGSRTQTRLRREACALGSSPSWIRYWRQTAANN